MIVAVILFQLGLVRRITALRVIYLDAILYFGGGLIGTAHHWYFSGQTELAMAFGATFSALEVVPLTLLTLDAWDFYRVTRGESAPAFRHRWTFFFLMAVGFWNFVGAGIFGFLINMPIVSYYEVGTLLTVNHGHAAFIGVFGMLGVGLMAYVLREVTADALWPRVERFLKVGFWGLNIGLAMMVVFSLFPPASCSSGTSCRTATGTRARSNTRAPRSRAPWSGCARRATWCSSSVGWSRSCSPSSRPIVGCGAAARSPWRSSWRGNGGARRGFGHAGRKSLGGAVRPGNVFTRATSGGVPPRKRPARRHQRFAGPAPPPGPGRARANA